MTDSQDKVQAEPADQSTRSKILEEAARLFVTNGYAGTSTRDIADAIGIRQPTLYWHFSTKQAIMLELIDTDMSEAARASRAIGRADAAPAARLYRFLHFDMTQLAMSPYNLIGLYDSNILDLAEFADVRRKSKQITSQVKRLIRDGVSAGEFAPTDVSIAREFVEAVEMHAGRSARTLSLAERRRLPSHFATYVLRGLLADPSTVSDVRAAAWKIELPSRITDGAFPEVLHDLEDL